MAVNQTEYFTIAGPWITVHNAINHGLRQKTYE